MKYAADYRAIARNMLRGFWPITIAITVLASILGGVTSGGGGNSSSDSGVELNWSKDKVVLDLPEIDEFTIQVGTFVTSWFLQGIVILLIVYAVVVFVIGGAVELGLKQVYIRLAYGEEPTIRTLFGRMSYLGKALGLRLMMGLFTMLWMLLFIIPGIIAVYRYAMAPYIMSENPEIGILDAIQESKEMMDGNKFRLFCLEISFIGWGLLSVFTCGIGLLALRPYTMAAETAFYLDLARSEGYDNRNPGSGNASKEEYRW